MYDMRTLDLEQLYIQFDSFITQRLIAKIIKKKQSISLEIQTTKEKVKYWQPSIFYYINKSKNSKLS